MNENQNLCMALMKADTEAEVVALLEEAGYWQNPEAWRRLGDAENNFSSIGNQQSEAVAALVEKLINSVDARLMNACAEANISPASDDAPRSIREAVGVFFEGKATPNPDVDGRIASWNNEKVTSEGLLLTLAATGNMPSEGQPSLTVADQGEGQEPDKWPDTFLSLQRSNKLRIHFVQGKFNMGGTGALQFCGGKHKLQLIISRRNPALVPAGSPSRAHEWGFTIVRREIPTDGLRSSVFTYLAPHDVAEAAEGGVLSFAAPSWPIFPQADGSVRGAYERHSDYGSLVKMYEYEWSGTKSNIVSSGGGLLRRIDSGLPELALPIRVFECRPEYSGHSGSFATNVLGLSNRLYRDRADKLEDGFPVGGIINLGGSQVKARIYAFKPGEAKNYRTARQGIIFSLNGQTHATFPLDFFRRKAVGMSYLAESLFVLVDCSAIEGETREDLFMNSRDRLRDSPLARQMEKELETLIKGDPTLKGLRNSRRAADLADKLDDAKPLSSILQNLLKKSPALSRLFLTGLQLPSPFPPGAGASGGAASDFEGKTYPTFFRFRAMSDGEKLTRDAHLGSRVRIALETDGDDDYFVRELDAGACRLLLQSDEDWTEVEDWQMRGPKAGAAFLTLLDLPGPAGVGDQLTYKLEVTDPSRIEAFENEFTLRVLSELPPSTGTGGKKAGPKNTGSGGAGGPSALSLPTIIEVHEPEWPAREMTELSALKVMDTGEGGDDAAQVFDFFVNVDNKYLRTAQKESSADPKLLKAQFQYALVLVGLALLQDEKAVAAPLEGSESEEESGGGLGIEEIVARATQAIAPVLIPMIDALGHLSMDDDDDAEG